jgi:hypothetical protein
MSVLGVAEFHRDYENTWEWVENDRKESLHVNISRPHNGKTGDYDVPILVRLSGPASRLTYESLSVYAQKIASRLGAEVWIGDPIFRTRNDTRYTFDIRSRFSPQAP